MQNAVALASFTVVSPQTVVNKWEPVTEQLCPDGWCRAWCKRDYSGNGLCELLRILMLGIMDINYGY